MKQVIQSNHNNVGQVQDACKCVHVLIQIIWFTSTAVQPGCLASALQIGTLIHVNSDGASPLVKEPIGSLHLHQKEETQIETVVVDSMDDSS